MIAHALRVVDTFRCGAAFPGEEWRSRVDRSADEDLLYGEAIAFLRAEFRRGWRDTGEPQRDSHDPPGPPPVPEEARR